LQANAPIKRKWQENLKGWKSHKRENKDAKKVIIKLVKLSLDSYTIRLTPVFQGERAVSGCKMETTSAQHTSMKTVSLIQTANGRRARNRRKLGSYIDRSCIISELFDYVGIQYINVGPAIASCKFQKSTRNSNSRIYKVLPSSLHSSLHRRYLMNIISGHR
jgi:hypothetical protein